MFGQTGPFGRSASSRTDRGDSRNGRRPGNRQQNSENNIEPRRLGSNPSNGNANRDPTTLQCEIPVGGQQNPNTWHGSHASIQYIPERANTHAQSSTNESNEQESPNPVNNAPNSVWARIESIPQPNLGIGSRGLGLGSDRRNPGLAGNIGIQNGWVPGLDAQDFFLNPNQHNFDFGFPTSISNRSSAGTIGLINPAVQNQNERDSDRRERRSAQINTRQNNEHAPNPQSNAGTFTFIGRAPSPIPGRFPSSVQTPNLGNDRQTSDNLIRNIPPQPNVNRNQAPPLPSGSKGELSFGLGRITPPNKDAFGNQNAKGILESNQASNQLRFATSLNKPNANSIPAAPKVFAVPPQKNIQEKAKIRKTKAQYIPSPDEPYLDFMRMCEYVLPSVFTNITTEQIRELTNAMMSGIPQWTARISPFYEQIEDVFEIDSESD